MLALLLVFGDRPLLRAYDTILMACQQTVVAELARDTRLPSVDVDVKTASLALVNAAICSGPGRTSLEFRLHIRHEFLMLGLGELVEKLRDYKTPALGRHIQIFEDVYLDDLDQVRRHTQTKHAVGVHWAMDENQI